MAPVQDTISSTANQGNFGDALLIMVIVIAIYLSICFITTLLNRYFKQYDLDCDETEAFWLPIMSIGCFFCRLSRFFTVDYWKKVVKKYSDRRAQKSENRKIQIELKIKDRTKGLTDL